MYDALRRCTGITTSASHRYHIHMLSRISPSIGDPPGPPILAPGGEKKKEAHIERRRWRRRQGKKLQMVGAMEDGSGATPRRGDGGRLDGGVATANTQEKRGNGHNAQQRGKLESRKKKFWIDQKSVATCDAVDRDALAARPLLRR